MPCGAKAGTLSTSGPDQAERDSAGLARPGCRTRGASPARAAEPLAVWVPRPRHRSASPSLAVCREQCARFRHSWLLTLCGGALQLLYGWGDGQESSAVWAVSPFWSLPLLPLFVSLPRKAWDRHGASASYQAWDSRLPSGSLKIVGEPRKAEIAQVQGLCGLQRHRLLKTL